MALNPMRDQRRTRGRGQALVFVALGLVMIIAMAGLAIDLASLYVARSEAQRAADAAALAGANAILSSGYMLGGISASTAQTMARQHAIIVGNRNSVGEIIPAEENDTGIVQPGDVSFDFSNPLDPRVSVLVQRTAARSNAVPTFFMKIFGIHTADVSAEATGEVYFGTRCVKPWMIPNCDGERIVSATNGVPTGPDAAKANQNCPQVDAAGNPVLDASGNPAGFYQYYVYPKSACDPTVSDCILHPGPVSEGGIYGKRISIKPAQPAEAAAPGKFFAIYLPPSFPAGACPACASGSGGGGVSSGNTYRNNIACCNQQAFSGGFEQVTPIPGNMVGPTALGVDCLIHQGRNGGGQDILDVGGGTPYVIIGGSNNPNPSLRGISGLSTSDSIVSVPLFDASSVCPGFQNCPLTVQVNLHGFLQIFIEGETNGTVTGYILGLAPAGAPPGGQGNAYAVRLIHN